MKLLFAVSWNVSGPCYRQWWKTTRQRKRLIRIGTADRWIPIGDSENRWMQADSDGGARGRTHEEAWI